MQVWMRVGALRTLNGGKVMECSISYCDAIYNSVRELKVKAMCCIT